MKTRSFLLVFLLAFLWSFTFLLIRIVVATVPPIPFTFYRLVYAFAFMLIVAICARAKIFSYKKYIWRLLISSIFLNALPFSLCAIGEVTIDSSTTGIIEGSTPFFVVLIGWLFFRKAKICSRQIRAFVMGFLGLIVIFFPFIQEGSFHDFKGLASLLGMAVSFAFGFNYSSRYLKDVPPISATLIQLFFAPFMLIPFIYWQNGSLPEVSTIAHGYLVVLGICTALGWTTYFYAIRKTSVINVSIATMITPLFTIFWGWLFLSEDLTWNKITGVIIVLGALSILWNFHGQALDKIHHRRKPPK